MSTVTQHGTYWRTLVDIRVSTVTQHGTYWRTLVDIRVSTVTQHGTYWRTLVDIRVSTVTQHGTQWRTMVDIRVSTVTQHGTQWRTGVDITVSTVTCMWPKDVLKEIHTLTKHCCQQHERLCRRIIQMSSVKTANTLHLWKRSDLLANSSTLTDQGLELRNGRDDCSFYFCSTQSIVTYSYVNSPSFVRSLRHFDKAKKSPSFEVHRTIKMGRNFITIFFGRDTQWGRPNKDNNGSTLTRHSQRSRVCGEPQRPTLSAADYRMIHAYYFLINSGIRFTLGLQS